MVQLDCNVLEEFLDSGSDCYRVRQSHLQTVQNVQVQVQTVQTVQTVLIH